MTKNEIITARIVAELANGKNIREAYEAVIGAGSWEQMAGILYDALRAKAAN